MGLETGKESLGDQNLSPQEIVSALQAELAEVRALKQALLTQTEATPQANSSGIADEIAKAFLKFNKDKEEVDFRAGIRMDQIPKEDILDVPVSFFAPCVGTIIFDDNKNGMHVRVPYNAEILFDFVTTRKMGSGKDLQTIPLSRYKCTSKAICKFMRDHSNYGVRFYESAQNLDETTLKKASRTSEIISIVKDYTIDQLMSTCKQYGVPFSDNYAAMKGGLAMAMAEREIQVELDQQKRSVEETSKRLMLKGE